MSDLWIITLLRLKWRETDWWAEKKSGKQINSLKDGQTNEGWMKEGNRQLEGHTDKKADRQNDKQTDRMTNRQTKGRQTVEQRENGIKLWMKRQIVRQNWEQRERERERERERVNTEKMSWPKIFLHR
jgi:hypothetical protein